MRVSLAGRTMMIYLSLLYFVTPTFVETANQKLLHMLLNDTNYLCFFSDKDVRPSNVTGGPLVVTIIPNQFLLLTMDQQQETIEYLCEFMMSWVDPQLSWTRDQTDFSEEWIKIPEDNIWVPDIVFDSELSYKDLIDKTTRMVDVRFDGTKKSLKECTLSLGSWIFDSSEIVVRSYANVIWPGGKFQGNNEWDMISMVAKSVEEIDDARTYSSVQYNLQLARKPVYYVLVIQAPAFIVGTMTLFGIFTPFSIHGERKEKVVTLGLTMLLSISMMFNLVSDMMPKASRLPLLGNYILFEIFMCAVAVFISIIILYLHHRLHTRVVNPPKWILKLLHITSCGCLHKPRPINQLLTDTRMTTLSGHPLMLETDTSSGLQQLMRLRVTIAKTVSMLSRIMADMESASIAQSTWRQVFDTLDLLFLLIFQVVNVIMAVAYMRSPQLYVSMINQTMSSPTTQLTNSTSTISGLLNSN
ncbi:hypothetical protein PRIPAC_77403 [Pristionchus pacificus]|uniref:Transmembrane ion channel n=1 Tax=Pristionchus pacificus TaxID=54126 RepID=A0A2A6CQ54_PRIPA|nr:hypothetical protein PRIPAC_77403 [Pristionchus pacificus]|eukprot:PDM80226.1 transmembrane ion channel [Pristionchus pacificus]